MLAPMFDRELDFMKHRFAVTGQQEAERSINDKNGYRAVHEGADNEIHADIPEFTQIIGKVPPEAGGVDDIREAYRRRRRNETTDK